MKRSLEISEEYEKNPGLNIGRLKGEVERQISKALLISGLILVVIDYQHVINYREQLQILPMERSVQ